jgi:hypothetical protein
MKKVCYFVFILIMIYLLDLGSVFADSGSAAGENEILFAYKVSMHSQHKIKKGNRYFIANIFEEYRINNLNSSSLEEGFGYKSKAVHDEISTLIMQALAAENFTVYSDIGNYKDGDFMLTMHVMEGGDHSISLVFYVYAFEYDGSLIFYRVTGGCMWDAAFQFNKKEFNTYKDKIIPKIVKMYLTGLTTNDVVTDYMSF